MSSGQDAGSKPAFLNPFSVPNPNSAHPSRNIFADAAQQLAPSNLLPLFTPKPKLPPDQHEEQTKSKEEYLPIKLTVPPNQPQVVPQNSSNGGQTNLFGTAGILKPTGALFAPPQSAGSPPKLSGPKVFPTMISPLNPTKQQKQGGEKPQPLSNINIGLPTTLKVPEAQKEPQREVKIEEPSITQSHSADLFLNKGKNLFSNNTKQEPTSKQPLVAPQPHTPSTSPSPPPASLSTLLASNPASSYVPINQPRPPQKSLLVDFSSMEQAQLELYLDNRCFKNKIINSPQAFSELAKSNKVFMSKLYQCLDFFSAQPSRQSFFDTKYKPLETFGYPPDVYCGKFVPASTQTRAFKQFLTLLIKQFSLELGTDMLLSHYVLGKALRETKLYAKFVVESPQFNKPFLNILALKEMVSCDQSGTTLVMTHPLLKMLKDTVNCVLAHEKLQLLESLLYVLKEGSAPSKKIRQQLISGSVEERVWSSYKQVSNKSKSIDWNNPLDEDVTRLGRQITNQEFILSRILLEVTNHYRNRSRLPRLVSVIEVTKQFDSQGFHGCVLNLNRPSQAIMLQELQVEIILNLLPLEEALYVSTHEWNSSQKNLWTKEIYTAILEAKSPCTRVFKALLEQVRNIYKFTLPPHTQQIDKSFLEFVGNTHRWLPWIEVWLSSHFTKTDDANQLKLVKGVLSQSINDFWEAGTFYYTKLYIKELMKKRDINKIYSFMTVLVGDEMCDAAELVIGFLSHHMGPEFMYETILKSLAAFVAEKRTPYLTSSDKEDVLYHKLLFLTKCVKLCADRLHWIESCLYYSPQSRRHKDPSRQGTGVKLIVFLIDLVYAFKASSHLKALRVLFDTLTHIVLVPNNLKKFGVALSLYHYEYPEEGSIGKLMQSLEVEETEDSKQLKRAIQDHLLALLQIPFVEEYLPIPSEDSQDNQESWQLKEKYAHLTSSVEYQERNFNTSPQLGHIDGLLQERVRGSRWLPELLRVLSLELDSKNLQIINTILENFNTVTPQLCQEEYLLMKEYIIYLNRVNIWSQLLSNIDVVESVKHSSTLQLNFLGLQNNKLFSLRTLPQSKPSSNPKQSIHDIHLRIFNSLTIIESCLNLVDILQLPDSNHQLMKSLIGEMEVVQMVNGNMCDKSRMYHFEHEYYGHKRARQVRTNILMAIASLTDNSYETTLEDQSQFPLTISVVDGQNIEEIHYLIKNLDHNLISNVVRKPCLKGYSRRTSILMCAVRVMTKCLLSWRGVEAAVKPSMYRLLLLDDVTSLNQSTSSNDRICTVLNQLLFRLATFNKKTASEATQVVDFLLTCLANEERVLQVMFESSISSFNMLSFLRDFVSCVFNLCEVSQEGQLLHLLHKTILFVASLLKHQKYSPQGMTLINHESYRPDSLMKALKPEKLESEGELQGAMEAKSESSGLESIRSEIRILNTALKYGVIGNILEMVMMSVMQSQPFISKVVESIFELLYLSEFPKQVSQHVYPTHRLIEEIHRLCGAAQLPGKGGSEEILQFVDANVFGYGRNFSIGAHKHKINRLKPRDINRIYQRVNRYNVMKSFEAIKFWAFLRWRQFFLLVGSSGKEGYSLSTNIKDLGLAKKHKEFGPSFPLLNSQVFKMEKGFEDMLKPRMEPFTKFIDSVLTGLDEQDFTQLSLLMENKFSLLEMALKWVYKLNKTHPAVKGFCNLLTPILSSLLSNCRYSRNSVVVSSLFNTVCLLSHANSLDSTSLFSTSVDVYLNNDCRTRNILLSGVLFEFFTHQIPTQNRTLFINKIISLHQCPDPDPMDVMIGGKCLIEVSKRDPSLLLDQKYFQRITCNFNLNLKSHYFSYYWILWMMSQLLSNQSNPYMLSGIVGYLKRIQVPFKTLLEGDPEGKLTMTPKHSSTQPTTVHIHYLSIYNLELRIVRLLFSNPSALMNELPLLSEYTHILTKHQVLVDLKNIRTLQEEDLLSLIPVRNNTDLGLLKGYITSNISLTDLSLQIQRLQCITNYLFCLESIAKNTHSRIYRSQCKMQQLLQYFQRLFFERAILLIGVQAEVAEVLECLNSYLNSLETTTKSFYTNFLRTRYTYSTLVETYRTLGCKVYEIGVVMLEKGESEGGDVQCEKGLKRLREWVKCGQERHREVYRKERGRLGLQ